jgi:hypothetical protein
MAIVGAFVVGGVLAIFFGFLNHRNPANCTGCQMPRPIFIAEVSIPKGTSGRTIETRACTQPSTCSTPSGVR